MTRFFAGLCDPQLVPVLLEQMTKDEVGLAIMERMYAIVMPSLGIFPLGNLVINLKINFIGTVLISFHEAGIGLT